MCIYICICIFVRIYVSLANKPTRNPQVRSLVAANGAKQRDGVGLAALYAALNPRGGGGEGGEERRIGGGVGERRFCDFGGCRRILVRSTSTVAYLTSWEEKRQLVFGKLQKTHTNAQKRICGMHPEANFGSISMWRRLNANL